MNAYIADPIKYGTFKLHPVHLILTSLSEETGLDFKVFCLHLEHATTKQKN